MSYKKERGRSRSIDKRNRSRSTYKRKRSRSKTTHKSERSPHRKHEHSRTRSSRSCKRKRSRSSSHSPVHYSKHHFQREIVSHDYHAWMKETSHFLEQLNHKYSTPASVPSSNNPVANFGSPLRQIQEPINIITLGDSPMRIPPKLDSPDIQRKIFGLLYAVRNETGRSGPMSNEMLKDLYDELGLDLTPEETQKALAMAIDNFYHGFDYNAEQLTQIFTAPKPQQIKNSRLQSSNNLSITSSTSKPFPKADKKDDSATTKSGVNLAHPLNEVQIRSQQLSILVKNIELLKDKTEKIKRQSSQQPLLIQIDSNDKRRFHDNFGIPSNWTQPRPQHLESQSVVEILQESPTIKTVIPGQLMPLPRTMLPNGQPIMLEPLQDEPAYTVPVRFPNSR